MVRSHTVLLPNNTINSGEIIMIHSLAFEADTVFEAIEILGSSNPDIGYTVFMCHDRSLGELRQRANETVYGVGGRVHCFHEHDCCGCWFLTNMEVMQFPDSDHSFMLVEHWRQNV